MKKLKPMLSRCPTCGRQGMCRRIIDVELDGGKRTARGIETDICPHCGEQLFDPAAMRKIEATCPPPRRRRRKVTA